MSGSEEVVLRGDDEFIAALVGNATQAEAAAAAGMSDRTLRRRLKDPAFLARLDEARREANALMAAVTMTGAWVGLQTLLELASDPAAAAKPGAGVRRQAAKDLVAAAPIYAEPRDTAARLDELERLLAERNGGS